MLKHIVMWQLKEKNKIENMNKLKEMLEALPEKIKEIKYFEVGINIIEEAHAPDIVLYSEFENEKELNSYATHPEHLKVGNFLSSIAIHRQAIDYIKD